MDIKLECGFLIMCDFHNLQDHWNLQEHQVFTHPRIHEGGHGEVDEDKEGDDPLEDGNCIPVLLQDVPLDTPKEFQHE